MHALFQSIRSDLGIPDLPIVFVKLGPMPNAAHTYWNDIKAWQQSIADAQPPGIDMVDASDLKLIPGDQSGHLDQPSQITLGGRMADAMYQMMPN
jgi:Carbohydrate esterase, sialic acid-specific acetylesterase